MDELNKTNFSKVLIPIISMMEEFGIGLFAANSVWSIVLGVLPKSDRKRESQIMEINHKDSTEHKVENIDTITRLAKLITKRSDYSILNITDFSYALRQLIRYSSGNEIASNSLSKLKKIYISYITSYYNESMTLGKKEDALKTLKYFGEEILKEDEDLREKLFKMTKYKMLS